MLRQELERVKQQRNVAENLAYTAQCEASNAAADATEDEIEARVTAAVAQKVSAACADERKAAAKERDAAIQAAKEQALQVMQSELNAMQGEKTALLQRVADMEAASKLADDPTLLRFAFCFEEAQRNFEQMEEIIVASEPEHMTKLKSAVRKLMDTYRYRLALEEE
jgi:hypothetical protein